MVTSWVILVSTVRYVTPGADTADAVNSDSSDITWRHVAGRGGAVVGAINEAISGAAPSIIVAVPYRTRCNWNGGWEPPLERCSDSIDTATRGSRHRLGNVVILGLSNTVIVGKLKASVRLQLSVKTLLLNRPPVGRCPAALCKRSKMTEPRMSVSMVMAIRGRASPFAEIAWWRGSFCDVGGRGEIGRFELE